MRTIKSSREIDAVFKGARRASTSLVTALIRETPEGRGQAGRVAFVAGKRMGNAVIRNRSKRVMRAAVRRAGGPWPLYDVVFIASARTGTAPCQKLDEAVAALIRRSGVRT